MSKTILNHGVTLIEILVAISLIVIIAGSCFVAYRSATETLERGEARVARIQSARAALDIMTRELSAAFVIRKASSLYSFLQDDSVNTLGIYFTTSHAIYSIKGGTEIYRVGYEWDKVNKKLTYLIYPNENADYPLSNAWLPKSAVQTGGGSDVLISEDIDCEVTGLGFEYGYYNASGDRDAGKITWKTDSSWDSNGSGVPNCNKNGVDKVPDGLPELIRIGLAVKDARGLEDAQTFYTIVYIPNSD